MHMRRALALVVALSTAAAAESTWRKPPPGVLEVLHALLPPNGFVSPTHEAVLLAAPVRYPPIAVISQPMLRLAGTRVDVRTGGVHDAPYWSALTVLRTLEGDAREVALPAGARVGFPRWSADGKRFAFTNVAERGIELWAGEVATARAKRLGTFHLNPMLGDELQWMPDQKTLLVKAIPRERAAPPDNDAAPSGPSVQETRPGAGPSSTYETRDVLKNAHDEALFDHYATSQLALVDCDSGEARSIGAPGLYEQVDASPDGEHILVQAIHRPYSYQTTHDHFPREVEIWNRAGVLVRKVASLPLADSVPIWGVPTGPRDFRWRANGAAVLYSEAQDGGDWKKQVPHRDRLLALRAPFDGAPVPLFDVELRLQQVTLGEGGLALLEEVDLIRHLTKTLIVDLDHPDRATRAIWEMSSDEHYRHPGAPYLRTLPSGAQILEQDGDAIYLSGPGGSPEGDRPFLDRFDLKSLEVTRLFRSEKTAFEWPLGWIDAARTKLLTRREAPAEHPNWFVRTPGERVEATQGEATRAWSARAVTHYKDPTPVVRGITKRLVKYKRDDGVDLSFTLYLPPGYQEGTRLPTVLWAYPLDYADASVAGQVTGSTQRFTILGWPLQLFFLLEGYAVIDNPSLPVVGDANKIYDTYMEQLLAGARAAVDKAVELGVTDRDRIGVTGHSHGGLMTVNLLAHSDLFRAGIARSGAYNRTLTAFGFQNERRTLWEARDVYIKVSPIFWVEKIKRPLLLIHGEADPNPGTVPLQSVKLFEALRGNGGTARLVMLPNEAHGYRAMETTETVLAEMIEWFDKHVKNAPAKQAAQ